MADVVAIRPGYYGRQYRMIGDVFVMDDEDFAKKPSWVQEASGKTVLRSALQTVDTEGGNPFHVAELKEMNLADLKDYAATNGIDLGTATKKADVLAAIMLTQPREAFMEPPAPVRVQNEVNDETGATEPDWIAPSGDI